MTFAPVFANEIHPTVITGFDLPMKILEISSCFPPSKGGVERCVYELTARFAKNGHKVTVATSSRGMESKTVSERIGNIRVIRFAERFHLFEAPLIPAISTVALTADYDVLHVHGMTPSITDLSILFAKFRRKPVVLTYHNDAESEQWGNLAKLSSPCVLVYCCSTDSND